MSKDLDFLYKTIMIRRIEHFIDEIFSIRILEDECRMAHAIAIMEWGLTYAIKKSHKDKDEKFNLVNKLHESRLDYIRRGKC